MICTRCGGAIKRGEKFHRTGKGPHHEACEVMDIAVSVMHSNAALEATIARLEAQLADSKRFAGEQAQRAEEAEARCREWNVEASRIGGLCGSEFHDDPKAVFARVRDMQDGRTRALKENGALRSQLAAAREALEFYAKHEHWMAMSEHPDALHRLLVANGRALKHGHGWEEAQAALAAGKEQG